MEGRTGNDVMFEKVNKKVLKVETDRLNEVILFFKRKSITERNNLIRIESPWVAEQIGLKKAAHRRKNELR